MSKKMRKIDPSELESEFERPRKIAKIEGKEFFKSDDKNIEVSSDKNKQLNSPVGTSSKDSSKTCNEENKQLNSSVGTSSKDSSKTCNEEKTHEGTVEDLQTPENIERGNKYLQNHTQTHESKEIGNSFPDPSHEREAFLLQNRVIDYNNAANRANIAADELEDSNLESHYLNCMEQPDDIIRDGYNLLEQLSNNPEAMQVVEGIISVLGNLT
jgi:hypothetical protein